MSPLDIAESHAPAIRLAAAIAGISALALLAAGALVAEPVILLGAAGAGVWLGLLAGMIWLRRENGLIALAAGTALISVYASIADMHAIDRVASLSVILSGVAAVLFIDRSEKVFLAGYSVFVLAVHFVWMGTNGEALAETAIAVLAFLAGAISLSGIAMGRGLQPCWRLARGSPSPGREGPSYFPHRGSGCAPGGNVSNRGS